MNVIHSFPSSTPSALVVGAGIAGLTAATLLRSHGWRVTLVERAAHLRDGGYAVDVRGSGLTVLDHLGLLEEARAATTEVGAGSVVTADGQVVAAMGGDTLGGRSGDDLEIERGDLVRLLADAAGPVTTGTWPTALRQDPAGVEVTLSDGRTGRYDVVLGCDGLRSAVRTLADLDHARRGDGPALRSLHHLVAVAELADRGGLDREETTFVAPGATALAYATATHDRARALLLLRHDGPLPRTPEERDALLRSRYPVHAWRMPEILAAFAAEPDAYLDAVAQVDARSWACGRVGLLGDAAAAASPASGQGTTIALVMAYEAVARLVATPTDPAAALAGSEVALRPFVLRNQRLGRGNLGRMVLKDDRAVRSTLRLLRVLHRLRVADLMLGLVGRQLHAASRVTLTPLPAAAASTDLPG